MPKLVAVQAAGCAPIARAFAGGADVVTPWEGVVDTKAAAIADRLEGYAQDGTRVLRIVKESSGRVEAVTDSEMAEARAALLRHDGLDAEFSACAGVALLMRSPQMATMGTVCIVTAAGHKHTFTGDIPAQAPDPLTLARLRSFLAVEGDAQVLGQ